MINDKKDGNIYINVICGWILQAVTAIVGLVLPKIILEHYGSVLNGMISSATQFVSYLSLVEFGIYNASLVALYKPLAEKNIIEINGVMAAINNYFVKIARFFCLLFLLVLLVYPHFVNDEVSTNIVVKTILAIGSVNALNYLMVAKYKVLLQADNKIFIVYLVHMLGITLQYILSVIVIKLNCEIYYTKVIILFTTIIEFVLLKGYCIKKYYYLEFKCKPLNNSIQQRGDIIFHQIAGLIVNNTDMILLTVFTSLSEVSVYTVYSMIYILITGIGDIVVNSTISPLGKLLATDKKDEALKYYNKYENYFQLLVFSIVICMAILILPFVSMYTSNVSDANYCRVDVGVLFSLMALTKMIRLPVHSVVNAKGHFKQTKNQAIFEATINIVISLALVINIGLPGVLIGTIISNLYRIIHIWYYCRKNILPVNIKKSVYRVFVNCVGAFGIFFIVYKMNIMTIEFQSYIAFLIFASILLVAIMIILFAVNCLSETCYNVLHINKSII